MTPHFTFDEVIHSDTAIKSGINNSLPPDLIKSVLSAAAGMEKVRSLLGDKPITVNSWYRCPTLNKAVGGAANSAHMLGYAVDFVCPSYGKPVDIVKYLISTDLQFDKLICEGTWVHISFYPAMRKQVLTAHFDSSGTTYSNGI